MKASIVIPYYNASLTIKCCVREVKNQMEEGDELIIVNDGSSEKDTQVLWELNQCRIISCLENGGAAVARNLGMDEAKNEVVVFIDADVCIQKGCLSTLKRTLSDGADACFVVPSRDKRGQFFSDYKNLYMTSILTKADEDLNYIYGSCCALGSYRKRCYWPTGLRLIEDNIWGYELWKNGARIKKITESNFIHLKKYTILSLIKNDYLVSYQFARFMASESRWVTLYTGSKFGHTDKNQKASVIIAVLVLMTNFYSSMISSLLFVCWLGLNLSLFKYFYQQRGLSFILVSVIWTYISHLVYFLGVLSGFLGELLSTLNLNGNRIEQD